MKYLILLAFLFCSWKGVEPQFLLTDLKCPMETTFVESLYRARRSIWISVYALTDVKVIEALKSKAKEGVVIEVIADKHTQPNLRERLGKQIITTLLEGKGLMHHKIAVIDEEMSWLGSANYTGESLRTHSNLMQMFVSKNLARALIDKITSLKSHGLKKLFPHKNFTIGKQTIELWFLPDDPEASVRIKDLIRSAKKTIRVAMYTFTRSDFAETLNQAVRRGVKVEVFMDSSMCEGASKRVKETLVYGGVKVYISNGLALLHHKMMVIDDKILEQGSANFTKAAFTQNDDYFTIQYDLLPAQVKELNQLWDALTNRSTLVNSSSP